MDRAEPAAASSQTLAVQVVYCPVPGVTELITLQLPCGSTVRDAVLVSGLAARHGLVFDTLRLGVWGKPRDAQALLRDRDRVEIYRPLTVDPKEARRLRYRKHRQTQVAAAQAPRPLDSTAV